MRSCCNDDAIFFFFALFLQNQVQPEAMEIFLCMSISTVLSSFLASLHLILALICHHLYVERMISLFFKSTLHTFHVSCVVAWSSESTKMTKERISRGRLSISISSLITSLWAQAPSQAACLTST